MTLRSRFTSAFALVAAAALTLTACSAESGNAEDATEIIVVTPYLANAATKEAIEDFTTQAEEEGWSTSVVDTAGDMNKLNSAFQDAAAQQPTAIVLGTGDPTQLSLGLKAAADADVPVYAIDAGADDLIAANVTSDNEDLGQQSAKQLVELIGESGSVVMLTHDPHPGVKLRTEGAKAVFEDAGIEILETKHVEVPGPVDSARASVQDLVTARGGDITGIWGGWDEPALGATQALEAAGVTDIPVVGVDGQDFAVEAIESGGPFKATVKQDWDAIATQLVELIKHGIKTGEWGEGEQFELPGTLVTAETE